jgi:NAD(P)-dependent dehydrogenase (short-subunit alcohol dehydrogenase family)
MSALEEKRKSHILKNNEEQKQSRKHMSNNQGQKLAGKIAVITGGSSGIGLATAKRFVEEGAHVVIAGRQEKELKEAAAFIERNVTTVAGDVTRLEDLDRLYAVVKEKHGHIDILFANAGIGEVSKLGEITEKHFDTAFGLNTRGTFFTVQKALPLITDGGSIIMTSSNAGLRGFPGWGVYAASKATLHVFARTWVNELKERRIRVNVLCPGQVDTPMMGRVLDAKAKIQFGSLIPRGKMGTPDEIATVALFLASDDSIYVNGVELVADGGMVVT